MAIVQEEINGFIHTYSDEKFKIKQVETGIVYGDAMDVEQKEYVETDEKIEELMMPNMMDVPQEVE